MKGCAQWRNYGGTGLPFLGRQMFGEDFLGAVSPKFPEWKNPGCAN